MEYELTQLERARIENEHSGRLIDLIDTSFHANGLRYPMEYLADLTAEFLHGYRYHPDSLGSRSAREAICEWYRLDAGVSVEPDSVVIAASASECYNLIFQALGKHDDSVLLPVPGYPLFEHIVRYARLLPRFYPTRFIDRFRIDPDAVAEAIAANSRFLVIISPNNPTGQVVSEQELIGVLRLCRETGMTLICDEVFSALLYQDDHLPRPMLRAEAEGVLVLTINGMSKLRSAPEVKVSWITLCGPPETAHRARAELELANDMYLSCTPLSQHLLSPMLADLEHQALLRSALAERRTQLIDSFSAMRGLELCPPVAGIHAIARLRTDVLPESLRDDETYALQLLVDTGVHLHPGYLYGIDSENCIVLSFLKEPGQLRDGLDRVRDFDRHATR